MLSGVTMHNRVTMHNGVTMHNRATMHNMMPDRSALNAGVLDARLLGAQRG